MEKQRWEESAREKSRSEKIRDGESQKKEDAGARKGRDVAIHSVFPLICGSGAKAAGAEPAGQMRDEKIACRCGAKHMSKSKGTKHTNVGPLLEVEL